MRTKEESPATRWGGGAVVRVLVADKNAHYRETIRRVLDRYGSCEVVGEAATFSEAVASAASQSPDLVLLDFDLVAREKVGRVRKVAGRFPDLRVVVLLSDYSQDYRDAVQVRWGYLCVAKDRVEEHLAWIVGDVRPAVPG
ncbi:MAG TPA: hypothetical protein VFT91_09345 [Dehalococcoidia bacterium]|nr:hypothetical protein [Dehalococcoidia bacterium]